MSQDILADMENKLEALRVAYERYFIGVDRVPPVQQQEVTIREIRSALAMKWTSTAMRFRADSLRSRMVTLEQYWRRVMRQIEDGTYPRHRFKMKLKEDDSVPQIPVSSAKQDRFSSVLDQYEQANKRLNKDFDRQKFSKLLAKQEAQLKAKYNVDRVEFRVVEDAGRLKLKAKPIK